MSTPLRPSLRDKLINIYSTLNIDTSIIPNNVFNGPNSLDYIYNNIYNVIKTNPDKYRFIVDIMINDPQFIICIPVYMRNNVSLMYTSDIELCAKLLIDTTSYYKCKRYDTGDYDEDGEPIEYHNYHLITHCLDYYFKLHFYHYYNHNPTLKSILEKYNVNPADIGYYKISKEVIDCYTDRSVDNTIKQLASSLKL